MSQQYVCSVSGETFQISDLEIAIRNRLALPFPSKKPKYIFQELLAFWQHFAIHKRKCDATGKDIISVFDENCPYPVWHKDYWFASANPPVADFDFSRGFFDQIWELFQKCPIPHNIGTNNENSEYTDDCWYSKNIYLSHSVAYSEDIYYCYRVLHLKDSQFCVFSGSSELCTDLIYSDNCYNVTYGLHLKNCRDSSFLFDCRNCKDCLFCWNLRNKQYCIGNKQYTKEEYIEEKKKFDLSSRKNYELIKKRFHTVLKTQAWWRASIIDQCENVTGSYIEKAKNSINCFLVAEAEDCVNFMRGDMNVKDIIDSVNLFSSKQEYYCSGAQDNCYNLKFCYNLGNCQNSEYLAFCTNCKDCFACCGLLNKQYCILNKQYSKEEYEQLVLKIKEYMKKTGESGKFFPLYFAANSYDESLAGFYFPLSIDGQKNLGFRVKITNEQRQESHRNLSEIPDTPSQITDDILQKTFWDEQTRKPFKIMPFDIKFCKKQNIPLHNSYYIRRIKENYSWIFFDGEIRQTTCAKTGASVSTTLPKEFDGRILSEKAYLEIL